MAYTDSDTSNYLGPLYLIGTNQTPFVNMMGGLGPGAGLVKSFQYPISQPYSLQAASQDTQSEDTAAAAGTPVTTTRSQVYNVCQIMKKDYAVTPAKESRTGEFAGIQVLGNQPVQSEYSFQREVQFRQLAIDIEYSVINGTFVDVSTSATNTTMRGIIEAISTNETAAGSVDISKSLIDTNLQSMVDNGAMMTNIVCFVNSFQLRQLSDIYGFAPPSRSEGGLAIRMVYTDFVTFTVVWCPQMPTATLLFADMAYCQLVFCPSPLYNNDLIHDEPVAVTAAKKGGFWYTQVGFNYSHEKFHGKITGLTTS